MSTDNPPLPTDADLVELIVVLTKWADEHSAGELIAKGQQYGEEVTKSLAEDDIPRAGLFTTCCAFLLGVAHGRVGSIAGNRPSEN